MRLPQNNPSDKKTPPAGFFQVDLRGFEPLTSSVRLRRAPNCATGPLQERMNCIPHSQECQAIGRTRRATFGYVDQCPIGNTCLHCG